MTNPNGLITASEAAAILKRSARTVRRLAESGELPFAHKLPAANGHYLFDRTVVELVAAARNSAA